MKQGGSIGIVETKYFTFDSLQLESKEVLGPVTIAYETYGELNESRTNAILILHAFSGDAHAAGYHGESNKAGWWNDMIGPDKAFDTDKYFVISSNVLGGCKGSTGPSSINPATNKPYGLDFPLITIRDMVNAQKKLIDHLGISKLLSVAGGSMGGMQVLQWVLSYPDSVWSAIPIATTGRHSPQQIAFNEVARQAIMSDPNWNNGDYYEGRSPDNGLSVARMIGHITYMSDRSMEKKFGRKFRDNRDQFKFRSDFEVEGYLRYQGNTFVERFDANSYLYISKAMDHFDITTRINSARLRAEVGLADKSLKDIFQGLKNKFLVISFNSDWLYPAHQTQELVRALKLAGVDTTYCGINSTHGHDSFLIDISEQSHLIKFFLKKVYRGDRLVSEYEYYI